MRAGASLAIAAMLATTSIVVFAGAAIANRLDTTESEPLLEATHLPPLLTLRGEPVELRYDVYCSAGAQEAESEAPCEVRGTVHVRPGETGPFRTIPLRADPATEEGRRYVAAVPVDVARSQAGFSYYAVVRASDQDLTLTLPAAGDSSPQRSLPLEPAALVELGAHDFGSRPRAGVRVLEAAWGDEAAEVGLEQGRNLPPIGAAAFDVGRDGTVHVLDEAHRRLLRWRPDADAPQQVRLAINGTLADMSVADDGTIHVLESTADPGRPRLLRSFGPDGTPAGEVEIAERGAQVRIAPYGPVVLQHPSSQWMPAVIDGRPLPPSAQQAAGRAGRPLPGGREVMVLRWANELRIALVRAGRVQHAWRITSKTALGEVQLADPLGNRLVVVVRVYTDSRDEYLVLELGERGLHRSFALDSADWAEASPLGRFRLAGSSLYRLGSTPAGIFVDRFDLGDR